VAPEDGAGRRAEGGGPRPRDGYGGEVQPGRLPPARHRSGRTAAREVTRQPGAPRLALQGQTRKETMTSSVSPLAVSLPELPPLAGVRLASAAAGIRYRDRTDVVMMEVPSGSTVAGVFTSNKCPGAPVDWCRASLKGGKARLVVVNAGNANVFTGKAGRDACAATAKAAAELAACPPKQVFVAS